MNSLPWIVLFLPLLAAAGIALFTLPHRRLSAALSVGAIAAGFVLSALLFFEHRHAPDPVISSVSWLAVGPLHLDFGLRLDPLSLIMLLVVTGVGGAIHVFSCAYMAEDRSYSRYFASLSLFTFSMLGIVLATNFVQMFIFWELVGVSSYLLIGFWFEKPSAADACKKAFLTNRLGDFGFLLGILLLWGVSGTVDFQGLEAQQAALPGALGAAATLAGLLIFCGAMGKSAQFPLHVWLPDAMEGPTPVSALIHAATMVAAGVYMLCRVFFLFDAGALCVISWIGGTTALLAALMAVQQNDIKRILAYSTLSQLGYMVLAVGLLAPTAAMFHLTTHAFFKALLFLGAGSVILALHHEQDIWNMGGLKKKMPITFWTFLIGTLALCGVPPLSGFYSKDAILAAAWHQHNYPLFALAVIVAALTAFYMGRLLFVAFLGNARGKALHAHETSGVMTWPLRILAVLSALAGLFGLEHFLGRLLAPEAHFPAWYDLLAPFNHAPMAAGLGLLAAGLGLGLAWHFYGKAETDPLPDKLGLLGRGMKNRFYFDEMYTIGIACTHEAVSWVVSLVDRWILGGLIVRGLHGGTELCGRALRLLQTGHVQTCAFLVVASITAILWYVLK